MSQVKTFVFAEEKPILRDAAIVILASLFIGLFAHVSIPLPFTPVPIVMQNQLILLIAVLFGARRAASATLTFLVQGAIGLPVFAGGACGIARFVGPTGGYLLGFLIAAIVVGAIVEKLKHRTLFNACMAMAVGHLIILACGASYLSTFLGLKKALLLGVAPFVIVDAFKLIFCIKILQWMRWEKRDPL